MGNPQSVLGLSPTSYDFPTYLSASASSHAFCGNSEGWGPLSPHRYDLTPCFLDVWVLLVSAFGILAGLAAIALLHWQTTLLPVKTNWHFYTKLAIIGVLIATTIAQAGLQIERFAGFWFRDFRFWTTVVNLLSLVVIGYIQYIEHWRIRYPSGVVLFYWLLLLIVDAVKLRSLVAQDLYKSNVPYFSIFTINLGLVVVELGLEWLVPKQLSDYEAVGEDELCPLEYASVFSSLTFSWMTPLMKYGYKQYLTQDDLWNLRECDTARVTGLEFGEAWELQLEKKKPNLWIALFRAFGGRYMLGAVIKILSDSLQFVQPQLLRFLIDFVDSYRPGNTPQPPAKGAAIAIAMFVVSVGQTVCLNQYFTRVFECGMRVKSSLTGAIYQKSMRLSNEGRAAKTTGDIVNHMAIDVQRLQDLTQFGQQLWSAPFQILLCMGSLYQLLGPSMFAGVGVMVLMVPINAFLAKLFKKLQIEQMKNKDARTRLMTEILNNMKSIKLYAWGTAFMSKLNAIRNDRELRTLRKIGAATAATNFAWSSTPFMVSCATFAIFVATSDKTLSTAIVFPALTLFNLLGFPLAMFPTVITSVIEASVAVDRLTGYFTSPELQPDAVLRSESVNTGEESVRIRDATFTWNKDEEQNVLHDINFRATKGELSCIVGRVGAGKSSLLETMMGNLYKIKGEVVMRGRTAYVAQSPWVMNASVRENIVFGHRWDATFYERTVEACALKEDFETLPDGDETQVGERGISLSGGQKARVTLARAVYARADIYLLDDVLSAVDQHVGRHLIDNVLGRNGLLASKTRILATNSIPILIEADFIAQIRDSRITERGTYAQLMAMKGDVAHLIQTMGSEESPDDEETSQVGSPSSQSTDTAYAPDSPKDQEEREEVAEGISPLPVVRSQSSRVAPERKASNLTLRRASTVSFRGPRGKLTTDEEDNKDGVGTRKTQQTKEFSEQGKVKWDVYKEYAKNSNLVAVCIYLVFLLASRGLEIGGGIWLKDWAGMNDAVGGNPDVALYIGVYLALGVSSCLSNVVQTLILWIFCSIEASRKLHEKMAYAIFRSPMSFFETTPSGRILNRFSSDIYKIDEILARSFNMLFANTGRAAFTLAMISVSTPVFVAVIFPLGFLYLWIQRYYLRTSRELKRLDSVSRSPIYAHFQDSLNGMSTIRSYGQTTRFGQENEWRIDANIRAFFPSICSNRWLAIRLEFIGSIIIFAAAGFAIISVSSGSGLSAGWVGLAMSYALQITQSLNWIVRQTVEVETNIVCVERVLEYARLPSEAPDVISKNRPPVSWPSKGAVSFNNYSTRYRPGLDLVLKNVSLSIKPHEKVGVVGRTGAGKSSLTLGLFRLIEPTDGDVSIDGLSTSSIGLLDLRGRLAIIPQDAVLFEGTIRDNLDPGHIHDDTELWSVLEHARLRDHVASMRGGLDAHIHEGGSNLSQGQRQLVSLARALLTPSNILVLDEATAAVDVETDALLQTTLRSNMFKDRTIITIAHRINTILDSDRIVVLDHGTVKEFDTPSKLIQSRGLFYKLVREAGLLGQVDA